MEEIKYSINRRLVDMTDKLIEAESKKLKRNDKINDKTECRNESFYNNSNSNRKIRDLENFQ